MLRTQIYFMLITSGWWACSGSAEDFGRESSSFSLQTSSLRDVSWALRRQKWHGILWSVSAVRLQHRRVFHRTFPRRSSAQRHGPTAQIQLRCPLVAGHRHQSHRRPNDRLLHRSAPITCHAQTNAEELLHGQPVQSKHATIFAGTIRREIEQKKSEASQSLRGHAESWTG